MVAMVLIHWSAVVEEILGRREQPVRPGLAMLCGVSIDSNRIHEEKSSERCSSYFGWFRKSPFLECIDIHSTKGGSFLGDRFVTRRQGQ